MNCKNCKKRDGCKTLCEAMKRQLKREGYPPEPYPEKTEIGRVIEMDPAKIEKYSKKETDETENNADEGKLFDSLVIQMSKIKDIKERTKKYKQLCILIGELFEMPKNEIMRIINIKTAQYYRIRKQKENNSLK
ncbi:MAG TPA: hypothetical protein PKY81_15870 [bacterium]|nr:hypothetical protein [bacterium]